MNETIAKKWVKALRSGKYKQAKAVLKYSGGGYCCLGVLQECVLKLPIYPNEALLSAEAFNAADMSTDDGSVLLSTDDGCLSDADPIPFGRQKLMSLAEANDAGKRFPAIANWIEKNWQHL